MLYKPRLWIVRALHRLAMSLLPDGCFATSFVIEVRHGAVAIFDSSALDANEGRQFAHALIKADFSKRLKRMGMSDEAMTAFLDPLDEVDAQTAPDDTMAPVLKRRGWTVID